jgi:hypothetical protein
MVGVEALVAGLAPLAGGVLLGGMAGKSGPNVPDIRAIISSDLELLQRIPEDQVAHRAALQRMLEEHVEALIVAQEKSREFQEKTRYFIKHWRDIVLFVTTVLFVVVLWFAADHHRPVWLPLLIATIAMSVLTAISLVRNFLRSTRSGALDGDQNRRDRDRNP